jgi:hypothetical protein
MGACGLGKGKTCRQGERSNRLGVFENRVLKRIFGLGRDEVMGEWRKLHNDQLRDLYSSPRV